MSSRWWTDQAARNRIANMFEPENLIKIANWRMPFGRYKEWRLIDLPEPYVSWFQREGFPEGELGELLALLYEIKLNGLEHLVKPLIRKSF